MLNTTENNLISVLSAALNGTIISTESIDLTAIYRLASYHSVTAVVSKAIPADLIPEKYKKTESSRLAKWMRVTYEADHLKRWFNENSIWYVMLKGYVLGSYYPYPYMREMGDVDILIDPSRRADVRKYMEQSGYETIDFATGNHDKYIKKGKAKFEIHISLIPSGQTGHVYYQNIADRLVDVPGSHEKKFTNEDFYIFFLLHAYKHYKAGGVGLRTFADCYLYLNNEKLDENYISGELEKLKLTEFEKELRVVSFKIFSNFDGIENLNEQEQRFLRYALDAGTFGSIENRVRGQNKIKYSLQRIFPPFDYYRERFPKASRWIVTIPFLWLYRIIYNLRSNRESVVKEFSAVQKS